MEAGQPSRSAMGGAVLLACHVRDDAPPWVFEDTMAEQLLDDDGRAAIDAALVTWTPDVRARFRLAHAVRARVAEDVAIEGLAGGRRDYVVLGAGLDTFAWRHPRAPDFTVWELDHPATQAWKRAALRRVGWREPAHVRFIAVDLSTTPLDDLPLPARATWSWLGVTMYLSRDATRATLQSIARRERGTALVVNFLLADDALDDTARAVRATAVATVTADGEPVRATYTRDEVSELLDGCGFTTVELLDGRALAARYFAGRGDLQLADTTVVAVAST